MDQNTRNSLLLMGVIFSMVLAACQRATTPQVAASNQSLPTSDLSGLTSTEQRIVARLSDIAPQLPLVAEVQFIEWDEDKVEVEVQVATTDSSEQYNNGYVVVREMARSLEAEFGFGNILREYPTFQLIFSSISADGLQVLVAENSAEVLVALATLDLSIDQWGPASNARFP